MIGEYLEGEAMSSDTIIDIKNGYYEEFHSWGVGNKTTLRQAAIFKNKDGSMTLGVSITQYDFVCYITKTTFYEISDSKDSISTISKDDILSELTLKEFIVDSSIYAVLLKYLPKLQETYSDLDVTIDYFLAQVYDIIYLQPQIGISITATLSVCDYLPLNQTSINPSDWAVIENAFETIKLEYDNARKVFVKARVNRSFYEALTFEKELSLSKKMMLNLTN